MLERAFSTFDSTTDRPTLVIVDSHIGYGAPHKQDTSAAHGEPLGAEEIRLTKQRYGWPPDAAFLVPDGVREHFQAGIGARGAALHGAWWEMFERYRTEYPELADDGYRMLRRELPDGWDRGLPVFPADAKGIATRDASGKVLNALARNTPWLLGGSADLGPSCKTRLTFEGAGDLSAETPGGRNLHFGIREHAMGAVLNGLSLSKIRPYGAGFLIFSDYGRTAIRLSALMELPVIHIFTHDSIAVGEDGPTHQPIEQLVSLRAIPGLITLRPADANEVVAAWDVIMKRRHEPVALVLTRQAIPTLDRSRCAPADGVQRGAYILLDAQEGTPEVLLLATGSEVCLCVEAHRRLEAGRHQDAGGEHAVVGAVRAVLPRTSGVSRARPALIGDGTRLGGERIDPGVGALCRPGGRGARHGDIRGLGAARRAAEEVRLHAGEHRGHSPAAGRAGELRCASRSDRITPASS